MVIQVECVGYGDLGEAMRKLAVLVGAAAVLGTLVADRADAIPAFSRRYEVSCQVCHTGYPKLNLVGQRFKESGFRMEREGAFDAGQWARAVPVSVRGSMARLLSEEGEDTSVGELRGMSAGNLGERFSYWVDAGLRFRNAAEGDSEVDSIKPVDAYLRWDAARDGRFYLKAGRMQMAIPFTQLRSPHLLPYEIYTAFPVDPIDTSKNGLEIGGDLAASWRWSIGGYQGVNDNTSSDFSFFLRASKRMGSNRLGGFAHLGSNAPGDVHFTRVGGDLDIVLRQLDVYGLYAYSKFGEAPAVHGGFVQADYPIEDKIVLTCRANLVSQPAADTLTRETLLSATPGVQVFIFERLKLSFEYDFPDHQRPSRGQLQAELAF